MDDQSNWDRYVNRYLFVLALSTLGIGTIVFHVVEKWSWLNAYYFSVVSLTTVGYGDFTPQTRFGKLFDTFYIMIGIGIVTTFLTHAARRRGEKFKDKRQAKETKEKDKI